VGRLRGIKAGTDEVEDAAELQVVANYLREELRVRFGVIGARREIGDGHAWLLDAEAGAGAKPIPPFVRLPGPQKAASRT